MFSASSLYSNSLDEKTRWKKGHTLIHLLFGSWHEGLILEEVQSCDCIQMRNLGLLGRQFCATAWSKKHNSNIIKFNELLYAAADEWAPVYVSAEWICSGCWLVMSLSFSVLWGSLPFLFSWLWHALLVLLYARVLCSKNSHQIFAWNCHFCFLLIFTLHAFYLLTPLKDT